MVSERLSIYIDLVGFFVMALVAIARCIHWVNAVALFYCHSGQFNLGQGNPHSEMHRGVVPQDLIDEILNADAISPQLCLQFRVIGENVDRIA